MLFVTAQNTRGGGIKSCKKLPIPVGKLKADYIICKRV